MELSLPGTKVCGSESSIIHGREGREGKGREGEGERPYAPPVANLVVLKDAWARIEVHGRELMHMGAHGAAWTCTDCTHGLID